MRSLVIVATIAAALLFPALPAAAHATLVETSPRDGAHLDSAPSEVTVTFDEAVETTVGAVRVFNSSGGRVDLGDSGPGTGREHVRVSLADDLGEGGYVVTWRAVSLDGHPVRGAFVFHVGEGASHLDDSVVAALLGEGGETGFTVAGALARWVTYVATLGAVGATIFQLTVGRASPRVVRWIRAGGVMAVIGSLVQIPLFAAEATGLGMGALTSLPALADAVSSPVGQAGLVRTVALVLVAVSVGAASPSPWAWVGVGGVVVAELLSGHTVTTQPRLVVMAADAIHVLAVATWSGGLAALWVTLRAARRDEDLATTAVVVGRFSTLATWSVAALAIAGLVLGWAQVRTLGALASTPYGWTLLAKSGVVLAVLAVGAYNNRVLVPAITQTGTPPAEADAGVAVRVRLTVSTAWARLARTLRWEMAGLVAVLAVTAVLVNLQPAAEAAGVSGPFSAYVPFGEGQLNLVVDPNQVGDNQIHAYVLTASGSPASVTGDAVLELRLPAEDVGPIVREPVPAGPGHWVHTGPELAIAGTWEITFRMSSGFDERTGTATVTVNP